MGKDFYQNDLSSSISENVVLQLGMWTTAVVGLNCSPKYTYAKIHSPGIVNILKLGSDLPVFIRCSHTEYLNLVHGTFNPVPFPLFHINSFPCRSFLVKLNRSHIFQHCPLHSIKWEEGGKLHLVIRMWGKPSGERGQNLHTVVKQ